ncbi:MAG: hypothetical protein GY838_17055, partial [bacterium]|nr:hypothetical protein [bacterium]
DSLMNIGQGVYQAREEADQGNYGWAAFYGGMSAMGARGLAKTPAKFDSRGVGAKPHSPAVGRGANDVPGAAKVDAPRSSGLDSGRSAGYEPPCPLNCFAAGTLVLKADGLVSIEEIAPGDKVWAYDSVTGELRLAEVLRVFEREVHEVWILTVGDAVIVTTAEHRFF